MPSALGIISLLTDREGLRLKALPKEGFQLGQELSVGPHIVMPLTKGLTGNKALT
jgi:hypothetical protein